jgi:hypothetical protein
MEIQHTHSLLVRCIFSQKNEQYNPSLTGKLTVAKLAIKHFGAKGEQQRVGEQVRQGSADL